MFLPGNHTLDLELNVMNLSEFSMYSESDVKATWIRCNGIGTLTFINIGVVQLRNLALLGCGENFLHHIDLLVVQNTLFHGYYDSGTALYVTETVANITKSSFLLNTGTFQHPVDEFLLQGDDYKEVGGAITAFQSKLRISECRFRGNSAEVGGALYIEESWIFISSTTFENNFADPYVNDQTFVSGGVMVAFGHCGITVKHSNFSNNSGLVNFQGVFGIFRSSITIDSCIFQDSSGSVLRASDSNITSYNSTYEYSYSGLGGAVLRCKSQYGNIY